MHRRISAPRSPGFGRCAQRGRRFRVRSPEESQIAGGKGIGPAQGTHGNVLCRPRPYARQGL